MLFDLLSRYVKNVTLLDFAAFPILELKCRVALRLQQANQWVPFKTEEKSGRNPMGLMAEEFGPDQFSGTPLYTKEPSATPDDAANVKDALPELNDIKMFTNDVAGHVANFKTTVEN